MKRAHRRRKSGQFYVQRVQQADMNENAVAKWDANLERSAAKKLAKKRGAVARGLVRGIQNGL